MIEQLTDDDLELLREMKIAVPAYDYESDPLVAELLSNAEIRSVRRRRIAVRFACGLLAVMVLMVNYAVSRL